ncbi:MAG: uridine kinase [Bacteroidetes bacterium]|nr:MAG: uridine kinase [Bacteroidota bacterium]TAG90125.1 MAG: uridine kinase [Bacteroidota bacterium]
MKKPYIIGITGASGAGKTSILKGLLNAFTTETISLLSQDNYYRPREEQKKDENGVLNFDLPESLDLEAYKNDIIALRNGQKIERQEYTFNNADKKAANIVINPTSILIVEGLFIFHKEEISNLFDLKVFIDVEDFIGLKRRILRDNTERGYPLDDVLYRYEHHVFPAYQQFIAPYKAKADIIIPNNLHFEKGLEVLITFLKTKV